MTGGGLRLTRPIRAGLPIAALHLTTGPESATRLPLAVTALAAWTVRARGTLPLLRTGATKSLLSTRSTRTLLRARGAWTLLRACRTRTLLRTCGA
ncbi:hypothetical protein [Nocardia tengchongensis]|uniref:hypothetical protein n=1 Tax=Nocardia tengchongensis TaxID=2055889 RepID=UPI0036A7C8F7